MIPASYLFKTVYRQTWEEPDHQIKTRSRERFFDGLLTPLVAAVSTLLARHQTKRFDHVGYPVYD